MILTALDDGFGLQVSFTRTRDRYSHRIAIQHAGLLLPVLESIEGSDQDRWPCSPPLQQLSFEERAAGPVALLIGMAGTSHWSVSVETDHRAREVVFDIACRARERPDRLASAYRLLAPVDESDNGVSWRAATTDCPQVCRFTVVDPATLRRSASELRIEAPTGVVLPGTIRWRYRLAVTS